MKRCNTISGNCKRTNWWLDAMGLDFIGGSDEELDTDTILQWEDDEPLEWEDGTDIETEE